jgi:hypothetical protein
VEKFLKKHPNFSLLKNPHQGKAMTVITGMMLADGEYTLFTDLDQATPIEEIEKFLPWFEKGFDIVIGSRKTSREGAPLTRQFMASGFMVLRTIILGISGFTDTQCGFKAFKKEVAQTLFTKLKIYGQKKTVSGSMVTAGFDVETLFLAQKLGFKIKELPVEWHYVETRKVSPIKDSLSGLIDLIKIRLNSWRGLYG